MTTFKPEYKSHSKSKHVQFYKFGHLDDHTSVPFLWGKTPQAYYVILRFKVINFSFNIYGEMGFPEHL